MILYRVELHSDDCLNRTPDSVTSVKARSREHAYHQVALLAADWKLVVIR